MHKLLTCKQNRNVKLIVLWLSLEGRGMEGEGLRIWQLEMSGFDLIHFYTVFLHTCLF